MSIEHEKAIKFLFVGDASTGKTSIIVRYVSDYFAENYRATQVIDFASARINIEDNSYRLQLWDIAGQDRYRNLSRVYYQGAFGAFIVFDSTIQGSLDSVKRWKDELDSKITLPNGKPLPIMILANKCDLENSNIDEETMNKFVQENNCIGWQKTSAKLNVNLDNSIRQLLQSVLTHTDIWEDENKDCSFPVALSPYSSSDKCC